jgi:hypothetical protein
MDYTLLKKMTGLACLCLSLAILPNAALSQQAIDTDKVEVQSDEPKEDKFSEEFNGEDSNDETASVEPTSEATLAEDDPRIYQSVGGPEVQRTNDTDKVETASPFTATENNRSSSDDITQHTQRKYKRSLFGTNSIFWN